MTTNTTELSQDLANFTGTDEWYKHAINPAFTYTEGVRHFAQNAGGGAYWLLDILVTQPEIVRQANDMAFVTLKVKGSKATLLVTDGHDPETKAYQRRIDYTDCPEGNWSFYMRDGVIMLP